MEKDLYIRILQFGDKNPEGFSYTQLIKECNIRDKEIDIVDKYFSHAYHNPFKGAKGDPPLETPFFLLYAPANLEGKYKDEKIKYILTIEAKFKYIDYLELTEAMKNAKIATRIAIASILITLAVSIFTIFFNKVEIKKPIEIINNNEESIKSINQKLDTLIMQTRTYKK